MHLVIDHATTHRDLPVAVKFIATDRATDIKTAKASFKEELAILKELRHPNVVLVMGWNCIDVEIYFVSDCPQILTMMGERTSASGV